MRLRKIFTTIPLTLLALSLSAASSHAYYTNMPASVAIGQPDFSSGSVNQGGNPGPNTVNTPLFVSTNGSNFAISDLNNNRVLLYNKIPTNNNTSADVVVGQTNFTSNSANQGGSIGPSGFNGPEGVLFADGKLLVAEFSNNRVLIFNAVPTSNGAAADVVIGQIGFTQSGTNQGGSVAANTLNRPLDLTYDSASGKLVVADQTNNRVLIYNRIPTTNNANADVVVGQPDFITNSNANTASKLNFPKGARIVNGKLIVSDNGNRVLIWNTVPTTNGVAADVVIGQADFTGSSANQGGSVGPNTLSGVNYVETDGTRLFISDAGNNRVLVFNTLPTVNNAPADVVIGQADFAHNTVNQGVTRNANTLAGTRAMTSTKNQLFVVDFGNNRILGYNNDLTTPSLSIGTPQGAANNLVKIVGTAATINHYWIQNVQYMVNGGGFNGATPIDGSFDSISEPFSFTFDPKSNNNTNDGYTVQIKSTTSNVDTSDHLFYFQPFTLNEPADKSFTSKVLPTFSFSVNKQQIQLKENLSKYQVMVKKSGGDWKTYIDNIPVDYASVQNIPENIQKSGQSTNGNGNYEDKKILVNYSNNNSTLTVTPKAVDDQGNANNLSFDQNGKPLSNGGYEWKVQTIDKNGHVQETETRKFVVGSSQFSNGSNWFPLQINSISGLGRVYLSTISPQLIKPKYRIQTSNPIFKGIATANSVVQLDLTNQTCLTSNGSSCVQTFTANTNSASQFTLTTSSNTLKSGSIYQAQFSVSQNGLFNALPPFQITR